MFTHLVEEVDPGQDVPHTHDAPAAKLLIGQPVDEVQHELSNVLPCAQARISLNSCLMELDVPHAWH